MYYSLEVTCTTLAVSTEHTHPEQWAAIFSVALRELGSVGSCSRAPQSWVLKVEADAVNSLPPPTIPAGTMTRTHTLWNTSLTL